jgi:hypothetical protein
LLIRSTDFSISFLPLYNYDICAEQNILFMSEMKQNKIRFRPKGWVQKIFQTFSTNFRQGHNEGCLNAQGTKKSRATVAVMTFSPMTLRKTSQV